MYGKSQIPKKYKTNQADGSQYYCMEDKRFNYIHIQPINRLRHAIILKNINDH